VQVGEKNIDSDSLPLCNIEIPAEDMARFALIKRSEIQAAIAAIFTENGKEVWQDNAKTVKVNALLAILNFQHEEGSSAKFYTVRKTEKGVKQLTEFLEKYKVYQYLGKKNVNNKAYFQKAHKEALMGLAQKSSLKETLVCAKSKVQAPSESETEKVMPGVENGEAQRRHTLIGRNWQKMMKKYPYMGKKGWAKNPRYVIFNAHVSNPREKFSGKGGKGGQNDRLFNYLNELPINDLESLFGITSKPVKPAEASVPPVVQKPEPIPEPQVSKSVSLPEEASEDQETREAIKKYFHKRGYKLTKLEISPEKDKGRAIVTKRDGGVIREDSVDFSLINPTHGPGSGGVWMTTGNEYPISHEEKKQGERQKELEVMFFRGQDNFVIVLPPEFDEDGKIVKAIVQGNWGNGIKYIITPVYESGTLRAYHASEYKEAKKKAALKTTTEPKVAAVAPLPNLKPLPNLDKEPEPVRSSIPNSQITLILWEEEKVVREILGNPEKMKLLRKLENLLDLRGACEIRDLYFTDNGLVEADIKIQKREGLIEEVSIRLKKNRGEDYSFKSHHRKTYPGTLSERSSESERMPVDIGALKQEMNQKFGESSESSATVSMKIADVAIKAFPDRVLNKQDLENYAGLLAYGVRFLEPFPFKEGHPFTLRPAVNALISSAKERLSLVDSEKRLIIETIVLAAVEYSDKSLGITPEEIGKYAKKLKGKRHDEVLRNKEQFFIEENTSLESVLDFASQMQLPQNNDAIILKYAPQRLKEYSDLLMVLMQTRLLETHDKILWEHGSRLNENFRGFAGGFELIKRLKTSKQKEKVRNDIGESVSSVNDAEEFVNKAFVVPEGADEITRIRQEEAHDRYLLQFAKKHANAGYLNKKEANKLKNKFKRKKQAYGVIVNNLFVKSQAKDSAEIRPKKLKYSRKMIKAFEKGGRYLEKKGRKEALKIASTLYPEGKEGKELRSIIFDRLFMASLVQEFPEEEILPGEEAGILARFFKKEGQKLLKGRNPRKLLKELKESEKQEDEQMIRVLEMLMP